MKRSLLNSIFIASCTLFFAACNSGSDANETKITDTLKTANTEPSTVTLPDSSNTNTGTSNEFVSKATIGGMTEVELGKIAQKNGSSNDVKEYGKMLEKDHAAANEKLRSIASAENISVPSSMDNEHTMHVSDMGSRSGADFDKAFIAMMLDDHEKDIAEFKKAAESNSNQKIKDFASQTLPTLQKHLDKARSIKSKMK
jgi:putative membrane protein